MRKPLFGEFNSPYMEKDRSTIDDYYRSYKLDPGRKIEVDSQVFSKIIGYCRCYRYENCSYHIIWEPHTEVRRDDVLVDENGNVFRVRSVEMISFNGEIPEWYFKAPPLIVTGSDCELGSYLTKK